MRASPQGPFAVLPQALALCAFLSGSELASAQTAARDSDASVTAGVKANPPTRDTTTQNPTTQSAKSSGVLSLPQMKYVAPHDAKVPDAVPGVSLDSSDGCTGAQSVIRNDTFRPCHTHSYAPQDFRAPLVPSSSVDEHRSGVILPGASKAQDNGFFGHFRLVDEGPVGERKHWSLVWVERPPDLPHNPAANVSANTP